MVERSSPFKPKPEAIQALPALEAMAALTVYTLALVRCDQQVDLLASRP